LSRLGALEWCEELARFEMADSQNSTAELLDSLRTLKEKNKKAISTSTHIYPASIYAPGSNGTKPDRRITSWKLTEHMFFLNPSPFPVLARGLFTESTESGGEKERIVARGYDKFFNTDEVDWTYVSYTCLR
jgi:tRNA ligase